MHNYFEVDALNSSKLKDLKKSPKHFWAKHLSPDREPQEVTEAMALGTAVHTCLFEHQRFMDEYIVCPEFGDKRNKENKANFEAWMAKNQHRNIINADDMARILKMRDAILSKKAARLLFQKGFPELELYWDDPVHGIKCKAKLDWFIEPCEQFPNGVIVDLKTTANADPQEFNKAIYNFGYYNQQAYYCMAVKEVYKTDDFPTFIYLAAEKETPFECCFYTSDDLMLEIGLLENRRLIDLYNQCLKTEKWYGYKDEIQTIGLPIWVVNKLTYEGVLSA